MKNPIDMLASRLEAARQAKESSMQDFIQKNYPGGTQGWQRTYDAMSPEEKRSLVPLSTRAMQAVGSGIMKGAKAAGGAAKSLADRLMAVKAKLNIK